MLLRILVLSSLLGLATAANATIIAAVSVGTDTPTQTFGAAAFVNGAGGAGNGATPGMSVNTISLNATIEHGYVNNTPFQWSFNFADADVDPNVNGNTKYAVTVNLTNNRFHPIAPVRFTLGAPVLTTNLFGSTAVGQNSFVSASSPSPTSTYNTVNFNGLLAGVQTLQFGGLNGGGGEFYTGQTATFDFTIDLADYFVATNNGFVVGSFVLTMVASPEPASLALAGFAMSTAGAGFVARRRKKKLTAATAVSRPTIV